LAREKAGMPVSKISEELGITEATVRRHLKGETKAGQMILKAYEKLAKEGFKVDLPEIIKVQNNEVEKLKQKFDTIKQILQNILKRIMKLISSFLAYIWINKFFIKLKIKVKKVLKRKFI
jgi:predicted transcriptional regulator